MQSAVLVAAVTIFAIVAYDDVRFRRIPNMLSLSVAALGISRLVIAHNTVAAGYTVAAGILTFAVTFLLFWRGAIGGGDAKLITVTTLLIGHQQLLNFLLLMSVSGGLLAIVVLVREKFIPMSDRDRQLAAEPSLTVTTLSVPTTQRTTTVPYGVAIAVAGAITLMMAR